jgi:hypothetical protein
MVFIASRDDADSSNNFQHDIDNACVHLRTFTYLNGEIVVGSLNEFQRVYLRTCYSKDNDRS